MDDLLRNFLDRLQEPLRTEMTLVPGLQSQLTSALAAGRAAWPGVEVPADLFAVHLADRIHTGRNETDMPQDQRLTRLRWADLYIACGCGHGTAAALSSFETHLLPHVRAALGCLKLQPSMAEELAQILREKLLVPGADGPPLISKYSGRGRLTGWIRVTSVNTALKALRQGRREIAVEDEFLHGLPDSGDDPELQVLKETCRKEFGVAFREAWVTLGSRERNLLQMNYIEGLSIDALGSIYHVHRATAARWLARARASLLEQTRASLTEHLGLEGDEFDSIMRLIDSQLDVTLCSLSDASDAVNNL